jgi:hypothetical protein
MTPLQQPHVAVTRTPLPSPSGANGNRLRASRAAGSLTLTSP